MVPLGELIVAKALRELAAPEQGLGGQASRILGDTLAFQPRNLPFQLVDALVKLGNGKQGEVLPDLVHPLRLKWLVVEKCHFRLLQWAQLG